MRVRLAMCVFALLGAAASAAAAAAEHYAGRSLREVLEEFRERGLLIVYSSDVVGEEIMVAVEPEATEPEIALAEILVSVGLGLERRGDIYVITPVAAAAPEPDAALAQPARAPPAPVLENVIVHASRYELADRSPTAVNVLGAGDIEALVAAGREPLRTVGRLPGAAGTGLSTRYNIRGGAQDEVLVVFDGLPLFEPFHLKDFQSVFSTLDPRVVGAMEVYTGGFPAQFGDRLSGVINVVPQGADERPRHEFGIDFFNVGVLSSGRFADEHGAWLVSARRGTLDLLFDVTSRDIGSPSYYDLLAQLERRHGERLSWSASAMYADDAVTLHETDRETGASADYRTLHAWLALDHALDDSLSHRTLAAYVDADSLRQGMIDRPEESLGDVSDRRAYRAWQLKQDWRYAPTEGFLARWGIDWRHVEARYRYRSTLRFLEDDLIARAVGRSGRALDLSLAPDGTQLGVYLSNRWRIAPRWSAEAGLRWDRQSYSATTHAEQLSPRLSLLYTPRPGTRLRAGWGRFSQAHGIHELQVADGVTEFFPAQRSYHSVLSLDQSVSETVALRVEVYRKRMDRLRPRFENLFDGLELLPELEPDRIRVAPEAATATGAELLLRRDRGNDALGWWVAASVSSVTDRIAGRDVPRSWDQRRALSAGLSFARGVWRADIVGRYHSGWPTTTLALETDRDDETFVRLGERNAARLPDFVSFDVRVARRKPLEGNRAWTLYLEITNAAGRDNVCCVDYSLDESADGDLFLEREFDHWLPRLPSVGFIYEF